MSITCIVSNRCLWEQNPSCEWPGGPTWGLALSPACYCQGHRNSATPQYRPDRKKSWDYSHINHREALESNTDHSEAHLDMFKEHGNVLKNKDSVESIFWCYFKPVGRDYEIPSTESLNTEKYIYYVTNIDTNEMKH